MSYPMPGRTWQSVHTNATGGGSQLIDTVLPMHVLTGLKTPFSTAFQVTGFFETMIKTTRKYSSFSCFKLVWQKVSLPMAGAWELDGL